MSARSVSRLARQIRKMHDFDEMTFAAICRELEILKEDGMPNTGMAYRLAYEPDYQPVMPATRARLGLPKVCRVCKRPMRAAHSHPARRESPARRWWNGLSDEERERIFRKEGMK